MERPDAAPSRALVLLVWATAAATLLMLTLGGLVTSLKAGLAYLDWPTSGGYYLNPPEWLKERDTMVEHGHRLMGYLLGLLGLVQLVWLLAHPPRRYLRWMMGGAFLLGALQGYLGGQRVVERSSLLAFVHGCTGQAFLCTVLAIAYLASRPTRPPSGDDARPMLAVAFTAFLLVFFQVAVGAMRRHFGGDFALQAHLLGAVLVTTSILAVVVIAVARYRHDRALLRSALALGALLFVQIGLGFLALGALEGYGGGRHTLAEALLPSVHQVVGATTLCLSMLLTLLALRRSIGPAPRLVGSAA